VKEGERWVERGPTKQPTSQLKKEPMSETEFSIFWNAYSWITTLTLLPTLRGNNNNRILGLQASPFEILSDMWRFGVSELCYWLQNFGRNNNYI
jgi:hypothetical protein